MPLVSWTSNSTKDAPKKTASVPRPRTTLQMDVMKVPESALSGHAFHTYQLVSPDGSVSFEFKHNVVGRTTYAEGTVDACLFLANQMQLAKELDVPGRTLFNMADVLRAGAMR